MKKRTPPKTPHRETIPGYLRNQVSKTARAYARPKLKCTCSYEAAGAAADEIVGCCFGTMKDHALWAWYCRHFDAGRIVDKAHEYSSMQRCGEVRDAVTAFQAWLKKEYRKGAL